MGSIKVHEFISLDGVFENPAWTAEYRWDPRMGEAIGRLTGGQGTELLLGRETYEMFAPAWSSRSAEDDPGVQFFNGARKNVVSSRDGELDWNNSRVIGAYDPERVRALRAEVEGDLYVSGSGTLVRAMLSDGLVDELHLFVFPIVLGSGERLFIGDETTRLRLIGTDSYESGVVHLAYGPTTE
ncbi:dihydrofolate reductase family protein [Terracoccus luteus]|uniref:Dihydrofolate reductase n=1 Tax=Terracoccus luteus TaxID=53356 RepID=A0A839PUM1_9MICO|nr:dihydrofolate reductase family protein [Terracoccus luteus]MBB2987820.1 dihydrofolate reductase [Terracoccus luteus]MCP2173471.1 dihydrofolate reductase [Terracoccus luteus]